MPYTERTIKRLFAGSHNECAMPRCKSPIIIGETVVGDVCHIGARNKKGPRYNPDLTLKERNDFPNLLVLCKTCHKIVDSNEKTYTVELLGEIKTLHESKGIREWTGELKAQANLLLKHVNPKPRVSAVSGNKGVSVAVGRDNHAPITVNHFASEKATKPKFPANSIGADANFCGYIEYLVDLANTYWKSIPAMSPGRLGKKIKTKFRLGKRTRNHLGVQRFPELVDFLIHDLLAPSPAGKRHIRQGTKLCRTFEEWRDGKM
ncbi:hypothetical protein ACFQ5Q_12265 [Luteolibacter ambystomatis]|uniref:hypothetical protein n=1 Tax=Luteolibacter ambystomatis TaxID=2824561 RepID=UPI003641A41E